MNNSKYLNSIAESLKKRLDGSYENIRWWGGRLWLPLPFTDRKSEQMGMTIRVEGDELVFSDEGWVSEILSDPVQNSLLDLFFTVNASFQLSEDGCLEERRKLSEYKDPDFTNTVFRFIHGLLWIDSGFDIVKNCKLVFKRGYDINENYIDLACHNKSEPRKEIDFSYRSTFKTKFRNLLTSLNLI